MTSDVSPALSAADQAAFAAYCRVRDEVARMQASGAAGPDTAPSDYWTQELDNIDYLADASPLVIRKLRHHAFQITGIRPYDYREHGDSRTSFERRLAALVALAGGTDLLVPESEALGGFGYRIDGRLCNVDTIKFFEALVAMRRGGLLEPFTTTSERRLVWEIGAGWGGLAYQFKTLFPNTTYVIVDFPELFLFSATYLATVFPGATIRFWREDTPAFDAWQDADFIFIPHTQAESVRAVEPDLLVNLVSFQEMTTTQVDRYVQLAAGSGCRALYSFNRDRSRYNDEVDGVGGILARHYETRELRLLGSPYTKAMKKDSAATLEDAARSSHPEESPYRHLVGTRRVAAMSRVSSSPVAVGVAMHNRAPYLAEALDSILAQSYRQFTLVLVDDGSTDGTDSIAREYERRDSRVRYVRLAERQGMIAAWRAAFEHAVEGGARYFAWGSDHDRWHSGWLARLVETLDADGDVVLAYPLTQRMDPSGLPLHKPARPFDTFGITEVGARWRRFSGSDSVAAGDMVYGLMRVEAVRSAGVFRDVLCPDRLLIAELTLRGQIRQVPEVLWYRRQFASGSVERQRATLFAPGMPVPSALTPPWYLHARALWATYGRSSSSLGLSQARVARMVVIYAAAYAWRHYGKSSVQRGALSVLGWPRAIYKHTKHAVLHGVYHVLVALRHPAR